MNLDELNELLTILRRHGVVSYQYRDVSISLGEPLPELESPKEPKVEAVEVFADGLTAEQQVEYYGGVKG